MKKLLLAGVALVALSTAARAADIGVAVAAAPAGFNWTGFYIGGTIGALNQNTKWNFINGGVPQQPTQNPSGGAMPIGITFGYNYEFNNVGVIGIEVDAAYFLGGVRSGTACPNAAFSCNVRSNWQATIGPRLGVVVMDRGLLYVKGGLAVTDIQRQTVQNPNVLDTTLSSTRMGFFVGVGAEYALANNWSIKFEYTYANYGNWTAIQGPLAPLNNIYEIRTQTDQHTIKVGFNYLFTTGVAAPVAVRY